METVSSALVLPTGDALVNRRNQTLLHQAARTDLLTFAAIPHRTTLEPKSIWLETCVDRPRLIS